MYSFEEFKKNINIKYDNWDDFGYKNTAIISIDGESASIHIYPNTLSVYNDIKSGKKPVKDFFVLVFIIYFP